MRIRAIIAALVLLVRVHLASAESGDLAGIAHVAFRVADLEKSRQFYETLGFEKAFEFTDAGKVIELFIKVNDRQFIELYPRTQDSQSPGLMHVCFEVSDVESLRSAYINRELNPPEAKKFKAGNLLFVLHDPEGQLLEYAQYSPGSLHLEDRGEHLGEKRISDHLEAAVTPVRDLGVERAFYVGKLGFGDIGSSGTQLSLPGNSGDELHLQLATATTKSQITFAVENPKQTADVLRRRGIAPQIEQDAVTVTDPDGTLITFRTIRMPPKQ